MTATTTVDVNEANSNKKQVYSVSDVDLESSIKHFHHLLTDFNQIQCKIEDLDEKRNQQIQYWGEFEQSY